MGRLQGARGCQKSSTKVQVGNQAGNHSGGEELPTCFPLLRPVYFLQLDQEERLVSIVMMYGTEAFLSLKFSSANWPTRLLFLKRRQGSVLSRKGLVEAG